MKNSHLIIQESIPGKLNLGVSLDLCTSLIQGENEHKTSSWFNIFAAKGALNQS